MSKLIVLPDIANSSIAAFNRVNTYEDIDMYIDLRAKKIYFDQVPDSGEEGDSKEVSYDELTEDTIFMSFIHNNVFFLPQLRDSFTWAQLKKLFQVA